MGWSPYWILVFSPKLSVVGVVFGGAVVLAMAMGGFVVLEEVGAVFVEFVLLPRAFLLLLL